MHVKLKIGSQETFNFVFDILDKFKILKSIINLWDISLNFMGVIFVILPVLISLKLNYKLNNLLLLL